MTAKEFAAMATAPRGAMIFVAATMALFMATSWTARGEPIRKACRRMLPSKRKGSPRRRCSRRSATQQRKAMMRLTTV